MAYALPHLHVTGNHYEVGKSIGTEFKNRINKFIQNYDDFNTIINPFIKTTYGKQILDSYSRQIQEKLPWYLDEMLGLSQGSEIDFDIILALNMSVELERLASKEPKNSTTKQCTDLFLNKNDHNILLHNEDADPAIYHTCYMVTCKISSTDYNGVNSPEEDFTCYCYPGNLPGNAFGFNSNGFVFGVNTMYSKQIVLDKLPHQICTRLMMSSTSLKDFEDKITNYPITYGVSINLGYYGNDLSLLESDLNSKDDCKNKRVSFNYELAPTLEKTNTNIVSKYVIFDSFYSHVNCYERLDPNQIQTKLLSSNHRKLKIQEHEYPDSASDLLNIASDDSNSNYPIYRTPRITDLSQTVATALFNLNERILEVFTQKPNSSKPILKIKMNLI